MRQFVKSRGDCSYRDTSCPATEIRICTASSPVQNLDIKVSNNQTFTDLLLPPPLDKKASPNVTQEFCDKVVPPRCMPATRFCPSEKEGRDSKRPLPGHPDAGAHTSCSCPHPVCGSQVWNRLSDAAHKPVYRFVRGICVLLKKPGNNTQS